MPRSLLFALTLLTLLPASLYSQTSSEFDQIRTMWRAANAAPPPKNFAAVIPKLLAYRKKSGGASWQTDYMLGVSYCFTPGDQAAGRTTLKRVLAGFQVPEDAQNATQQVLDSCGQQAAPAQSSSFEIVPVSGVFAGGVTGKGGYRLVTGNPERVNPPKVSKVSYADLEARVFPPDQTSEALAAANLRLARYNPTGKFVDGFIMESTLRYDPTSIADCLAKYRTALQSEFGMELPASPITIYVVDAPEVPRLAATLHGVVLPLGTVAYSVVPDLSIVGVVSPSGCGTLAHELTHLAIHQNFGDSPAWLEEGLASEVAVGLADANRFRFLSSWRDDELRRDWKIRPSVTKLLQLSWGDYSTTDPAEIGRVASTHAMAATFIRYLDARNKLIPIYTTTRETLSSPDPHSPEEILTAAFGKTLNQIDADFALWFTQK